MRPLSLQHCDARTGRSPRAYVANLVLATAVSFGLALCPTDQAFAQSPSNIRSGTASGSGGLQLVTLFNVPGGFDFVLTDLEWNPDMTMSTSMLRLPLSLQSSGGACISGPRASWFALLFNDNNGGRHTANIPLHVHWGTGIVFCPATMVQLNIGDLNALTQWQINWSGYLVASGMSAVEGEPGPDLALGIVPNPATRTARIEFKLPSASSVIVGIFDVQGRRVRTVFKGTLTAGSHSIEWDGRRDDGSMANDGVYLAQLETPQKTQSEKLTKLR